MNSGGLSPQQADLLQALLREEGIAVEHTTIPARDHGPQPPMSVIQEQMWFTEQLSPGNSFYNLGPVHRLRGPLDVAALRQALTTLVTRHSVLRSHYPEVDGSPVQSITPPGPYPLTMVDVADRADPEGAALLVAAEAMNRRFDLATDELLRAVLIRLSDDDHIAVFAFQHIVADGAAVQIFLDELEKLYAAAVSGVEANLPALALQYADFAAWQREWLGTDEARRQAQYWRDRLDGAPELLDISTDHPRPTVQSYAGAAVLHVEHGDLVARLEALARREGVSLFMVVLAALQISLAKYTGETDIVVGTPTAGRPAPELDGLIGCFFNILPLRTDLSGNPSLHDVLTRVRDTALEAYANQDVPFQRLIEDLCPKRDLSHNQITQVLLSVPWDVQRKDSVFADLAVAPVEIPVKSTVSDLMVYAWPVEGSLCLHLIYAADLFEKSTVERLGRHLVRVLEQLVTTPGGSLSDVDLLSARERRQVVSEWNSTGDGAPPSTLVELWDRRVQLSPDGVAVVAGGESVSFGEVDRRATGLADVLRSRGVGPESVVGVCVSRSVELVAGLLGVLKTGAAFVPLDAGYPMERLRFMVADSGVELVVVDSVGTALPIFDDGVAAVPVDQPGPDTMTALPRPHPENLAYVIYTSGSTGVPKGVAVRHGGIAANITDLNERFGVGAGDRVLGLSAVSFDMSVYELVGMPVGGGAVVLPEEGADRDPQRWLELVTEHGITVWNTVPARLGMLVDEAERTAPAPSPLRLVLSGGDRLPVELPDRVWRAFGANVEVVNLGGATEASIHSTIVPIERDHLTRPMLPYGRPMADQTLYVVDQWSQPVPTGVVGELWIGGAGVSRGYLGRAGLTAQRFVADPFGAPGGRVYRTGDLARWRDDGCVELVGRADHQVKVHGFRVELGEVESVVGSCTGVQRAVVVARKDCLVAFVVGEVDSADLRGFCADRLPGYMVPQVFTVVDRLPVTPNGKIDRRALTTVPATGGGSRETVSPRTPSEEIVAVVFGDVLSVPEVGAFDDFFELGGHSLLATRAVARIRDLFDVEVPLRTLFENPTVEAFASAIDGIEAPDGTTVRAFALVRDKILRGGRAAIRRSVVAGESVPLSAAQERIWFLDQLGLAGPAYNIPMALAVRGNVRPDLLERCFLRVVTRHEVLRSRITLTGQRQPVQTAHPVDGFALPVVEVATRDELDRLITEESRRPFDLARALLLRAILFRLPGNESVLLVVAHHIACDGWSFSVLLREVGELYEAWAADRAPVLGELAIQYADFAVWQRDWLRGEVLDRQLAYWRDQLSGLTALELPSDRVRPAVATFTGGRVFSQIPAPVTEAVRVLCHEHGTTLFMTLLAGFQVLLARYSGQYDVAVGTPVAGRLRSELEGLVGCFVNTLVLRTDLSDDPSAAHLLARVREVALGAFANQDVPFERLVERLQPRRDLSRNPLYQVMFAVANEPAAAVSFDGVPAEAVPAWTDTTKVDLSVYVYEAGDELLVAWGYATNLFDRSTVERLGRHLVRVLEQMVSAPTARLSALELITPREREQQAVIWNDTAAPVPSTTLADLWRRRVAATPDATGVVSGAHRLTYGQLDARSNQLAHLLVGRGVGPESIVAIAIPRGVDMLVALLAVIKAGGAYLPIDPSYPADRIDFMIADARPVLVLDELPDARDYPATDLAVWQAADNAAYIIYTSGSTGRPKGVVISHASITSFLHSMAAEPGLAADDRVLGLTPLSFDISALEIFLPCTVGAAIVLAPAEANTDPRVLASTLTESGVTVMQATPSTWRMLVESGWACDPGLLMLSGGEALDAGLARALRQRGGRLWNLYGPTETTVWSTAAQVEGSDRPVSVGTPIRNTQVYVVDQWGRLVPPGVVGELWIGGVGVSRGYVGRAGLTAQRFVADPFGAPGGRVYRTGDLARWRADGCVELVGRADHQVKVRGVRVELGEVESVVSSFPGVERAVVVAREDRLVAFVVGEEVDVAGLRSFCGERLPGSMVPQLFAVVERLPLTPNGKVDRRALTTAPATGGESRATVSPRTRSEEVVAAVFADVLGVAVVGAFDDFFELGGHSLLATKAVARLQDVFDVEVPLRTLFENPTVESFAKAAEGAAPAGERSRIVRLDPTVPAPLSLQQAAAWHSAHQLGETFAAYNIPLELWLYGDLDVRALERGLADLIADHDILRTTFPEQDGVPVQVVAEHTDFTLNAARATRAEVTAIAQAQASTTFSLKTEPPWRIRLLSLGDGEHVLLITLHHILADGWSMDQLARQLGARYTAHAERWALPVRALPVQYADYAAWQRGWLGGREAKSQADYWADRLRDITPLWDRAIDPAHPDVHRGVRHCFTVPPDTAAAFRELGKAHDATLFVVMLTGFMLLLAEASGVADIAVGTPVAGRTRSELDALIGYFAHIIVLRTDLDGAPETAEALARVRETVLAAFANQEVSVGAVMRELESSRYRGRVSLFQTHFSLTRESRAEISFGGLTARAEFTRVPNPIANIDLELEVVERHGALDAWLICNGGMFRPEEIAELTTRLLAIYARMGAEVHESTEQSRPAVPRAAPT